jgi:hypothetical protein
MRFEEETGRGTLTHASGRAGTSGEMSRQIVRLQVVTLIWMVVECALALFSAWRAAPTTKPFVTYYPASVIGSVY